jgi:hypothetical protein
MLIYTSHITNKTLYTFDFVFKQQFGIDYFITNDLIDFKTAIVPKFNYSNEIIEKCIKIVPHTLLKEEFVQEQQITTVFYKGVQCPFAIENGVLPFDIFAATFYLISRYEEYLPHQQNKYGQFQAKDSFAYKNNFLHLPVIDIWLADLKNILQNLYPELRFSKNEFIAQMTYDIDTAYAYKGRDLSTTIGSICKDVLKGSVQRLKNRFFTLFGNGQDEFDTYNYIINANQNLNKPIFFFLIGDRGEYNRNINYESKEFIQLVKAYANEVTVGLHPSYDTPRNSKLMKEEKGRLESITQHPITNSRQHYLRFYFPTTFNKLMDAGITNDYSMGYAELPGFRASTCMPFYFFDLVADKSTTLKIHPVAFMEGTFAEDMQLSPDAALPIMEALMKEVKQVQGNFICIWHNHTLSDTGFWKGWKAVHDEIIKLLKK